MNKNEENLTKTNQQDNDIGLASCIFGITSLFILAHLFVPLALLFGVIAIVKKQIILGFTGVVCGIIGFVTSPILFSMVWLAITGSNINNQKETSDSITPQTYSQASVKTDFKEQNFFHDMTDKAALILDSINCKFTSMGISTREPCSHPDPVSTVQNPKPIAQTQLLPEFISFLQTYPTKVEKKAIALAQDSHRRAAWGYSYNYATQTQANDRALLECRSYLAKYRVETDCKLYAIGDQVVWDSGSDK
jgi:hypothetical protein